MLEEFKKYLIQNKLSENSINSYISDLKQFIKYYEDSYGEKLTKLNSADVRTYISYLTHNLNFKPKTINRKITAINTYNQFLIEIGIQENIVLNKRDYIKIQRNITRKTIPTDKEINLLKHLSADNKRDYCFICLLIYGGFRESEVVNIKINHVHLEERFIEIIGKGNKYRRVLINDNMYYSLIDYLEERKNINKENSYLFVGKKSCYYKNKPLSRNVANRILAKYNKDAKINNLHPHKLRDTFCTNAIFKAGYTIEQTAAQAGHTDINTTKGYIGIEEKDILKKANAM